VLADLAQGKLRKKIPQLERALAGRFSAHHALMVGHMLARMDFLEETIAQLTAEIEQHLSPFAPKVERLDLTPGVGVITAQCRPRRCRR
jgi:transposase